MNPQLSEPWTADSVLELSRAYQRAAVLAAAVDLEIFTLLASQALPAAELAQRHGWDLRGTTVLLDALAALRLLDKEHDRYFVPSELQSLLAAHGPGSVLAMAQHQANCLRRWSQIARAVQTGAPPPEVPSVRGPERDLESFIEAMDNVSAPVADDVIAAIKPLSFRVLLDVGGGSGTWTLAFLRACPAGRAILFDLPEVIPLAVRRASSAGLQSRLECVPGDYNRDELPKGADLAWISAIVHQNSRRQNQELFGKVRRALLPGGRIAIREILMEENRISPVAGALFAINMLVGTERGGTYTAGELRQDLELAGFQQVQVARDDGSMNSILTAVRP